MKRFRTVGSVLLVLLIALSLNVVRSGAVEGVDIGKDVSLTIEYTDPEEEIGIEADFRLYKVADMLENGSLSVIAPFDAYPVSLNLESEEEWDACADTLSGYIRRDHIEALSEGTTDENGILVFAGNDTLEMKPGLYLVIGDVAETEGYIYTCSPFFTVLPAIDEEESAWNYDVTAEPKHEKTPVEDETISRRVCKVWADAGFETIRPESIEVSLLCDNDVYETVTLSAENDWRYEWTELEPNHNWSIVETELSGYDVVVTQEGVEIVVTNTFIVPEINDNIAVTKSLSGGVPAAPMSFKFTLKADDPSYPMPAGSVNGVKTIEIINAGTAQFGRIDFQAPGVYTYTVVEEDTHVDDIVYDNSIYNITFNVTETPAGLSVTQSVVKTGGTPVGAIQFINDFEPPLPITGIDWKPVYLTAFAGAVLLLLGIMLRRNSKESK